MESKYGEERVSKSNVIAKMDSTVPEKLKKLIRTIGAEGDAQGITVFLVGGFVRDLFLGQSNYDLDIVVEGKAIQFARILKEKIGGSLVEHKKFGTVTLVKKWPKWLGSPLRSDRKFKIDIAAARKELYEKPATLPTVEFSSLREDLCRRDFTINAMAVNINRSDFGLFVDLFDGLKDLEQGVIRVLHDKSFIDDPTRIFRAVRFEQRFGFTIEKNTAYYMTHAVRKEMFQRTGSQRIRDELILMLKEKNSGKAVLRMSELHELLFVHPDMVLPDNIEETFNDLKKCINWYVKKCVRTKEPETWIMNFMAMVDNMTLVSVEEVLTKFVFTRSVAAKIRVCKKKSDIVLKSLSSVKELTSGEIYDLLDPLPHEVILYIMAKTSSRTVRRHIKKFFTVYSGAALIIKGNDIEKEGISPGPEYREILKKMLHKKLENRLPAKKDELKYLRQLCRSYGNGDL